MRGQGSQGESFIYVIVMNISLNRVFILPAANGPNKEQLNDHEDFSSWRNQSIQVYIHFNESL